MSSFLILCNNNKWFLNQIVTREEKILRENQLSGWTEMQLQSTSQSQTCTKKKGSWSLFGGLLPVWSTTTFWIPVKPLHLTSMLSKSIRCTKMPAANIGEQKGPSSSPRQCLITRHTISTSKAQRLGYNILPYVPCSPDFLPTDYHFFKHLDFLQGKCFHNQQEAKNAFQKFVKS